MPLLLLLLSIVVICFIGVLVLLAWVRGGRVKAQTDITESSSANSSISKGKPK